MTSEARTRAGAGDVFASGDGTIRVIGWERRDTGLWAVIDEDGERQLLPHHETLEILQERVPRAPIPVHEHFADARFAFLPPGERWAVKARLSDLLEMMTGDPGGLLTSARPDYVPRPEYDPRTTNQRDRIRAKSREMRARGVKGCSESNLYKQRANLLGPEGVESLIHKSRMTSRDGLASLDPRVFECAQQVVAALALPSASTAAGTTRTMKFEARLIAEGVDYSGIPKRLLRRALQLAEAGTGVDKPASTRESQNSRPKGLQGSYVVSRPGELVQVDATKLDVLAWTPFSGWISVDALTAIDAYDRQILAFRLVPAPHTARDVSLLLYDMLTPRVRRGSWTSGAERQWHGLPETVVLASDLLAASVNGTPIRGRMTDTVVMDHGAQFDNQQVLAAAARAGLNVIYGAPGRGAHKGIVEAWHNQLKIWSQEFVGAKGNRTHHRGRKVEDEAVMSIDDLEAAFYERITMVYHHKAHDGLRDPVHPGRRISPAEAYQIYILAGGVPTVLSRPDAVFDFLPGKMCRALERGIELNGLRYDGPGLHGLRDGDRGRHSTNLRVHWDPYDPVRIYVQDPSSGNWQVVLEHSTQAHMTPPLAGAKRRNARDLSRHQLTMSPADVATALAVINAVEATDIDSKKQRREGALAWERLMLAGRDRHNLGLALLAPDPAGLNDPASDERQTYVDPDPGPSPEADYDPVTEVFDW